MLDYRSEYVKPWQLTPERPVGEYARRVMPGGDEERTELHASFEVGLVLDGVVRRDHGSGWFDVGRGQCWIIPPLQPHCWQVKPEGYARIVYQVLPSLMERLPVVGEYDLMRPFLTPAYRRVIGIDDGFRKLFCQFGDEVYARRPPSGTFPQGQALFDFLRLIPIIAQEVLEHSSLEDGTLDILERNKSVYPALQLAERHTDRSISLDEAAAECGMGRSRFTRIFRMTMGISFAKYHLRSRLVLAAEALVHTSIPIKAIADRFGFSDVSHFYKCFQKHYGTTPTCYRETGE
ncbi:MAG: AraC family transcriptional regulator [Candidatus Pacebacteria bacterium]|nr:AraC family transcriptional regulator [Candidatus Paceibacterota bacterium]